MATHRLAHTDAGSSDLAYELATLLAGRRLTAAPEHIRTQADRVLNLLAS